MSDFATGTRIRTASGGELEIIQKLGAGGQGTVYKVKYEGKQLALKWYFENKLRDKKAFYKNIVNNIKEGAPTRAFLWPLEITEYYEGSYGYLMELRPNQYKEFSQFLLARERFSSITAVINAALQISDGFNQLHRKGFSYQDLNDGNFFINPKTGDVLICDNDNVAQYGEGFGIAGKSRYMAPEVVLGKETPSEHTDRFSLAVILYMLLFLNHPLEGSRAMVPCLTEEWEKRIYGAEPLFVWDANDDKNRPVRGVHMNELRFWPIYPKFIRAAFEKAFSQEQMIGADVQQRITDKEWLVLFTRLRDILVVCNCGDETFVNPTTNSNICINCGRQVNQYLIMQIKKYRVVLNSGKKLYDCHINKYGEGYKDYRAEVIPSKNNPNVYGLRNCSGRSWEAIIPNGTTRTIDNNSVIKLGRGLKIDFGDDVVAEIF